MDGKNGVGNSNGWPEWKNAVLQKLEELGEGHKEFRDELMALRLDLVEHKTRVITWAALVGTASGFIGSVIVAVILKSKGWI